MTCTSCGASMPPESRFCPECGAPTFPPPGGGGGGEAGAGAAGAPPASGAGAPPFDQAVEPAAAPGSEAVPPAPGAPAPAPDGGGGGRGIPTAVKVLVPLVVLLGAAALVYAFVSGSDGGTGADSPEGAVRALADSLADDDLLGALATMAPDEVGPLSEVVELGLERAGELELVDVTETGLADLDLRVGELRLEVEEVHPEVAKVTIAGGSIAADLATPDVGLALVTEDRVQLLEAREVEGDRDLTDLGPDAGVDETFVMTVRRDGEWYVSPLYTLAELLRESEGAGDADFSASRGGVEGAGTPVQAVEEAARAIEGLDLEAGAQVLPPSELGIARDYLEALLGEIDEDELEADRADLDLRIDGLSVRETDDLGDGRRRVVIESFDYSFDDDGETTEGRFEGRCVEVDGEEPECLDDVLASNHLDPVLAELLPDEIFVVAVEEDGGWFVSPVETAAAYLRDVLGQVEDQHLTALGLVEPVAYELGSPREAELASPYLRDAFTFEVEEDVTYLATIETEGDLPVQAAIHPVGAELWEGGARARDDGASTPGVFTAVGTRYAMSVTVDLDSLGDDDGDPGDEPVPYVVHVRALEVEDELELDEPVEVELEAGEVVAYEFTPPASAEARGVVEGEVRVDLIDPEGFRTTVEDGVVEPFYSDDVHLVVVTAREDGEATVGFEPVESEDPGPSGDLLIEPPETIENIDEIPLGEVQRITFAEGDIYDFAFTGTGEEVTIVAAGDDASFDPVLVIFDEDLEVVAQNEGDPADRRAEEVLETEEGAVYVVSVAGFQGMAGDARVVVRPAE